MPDRVRFVDKSAIPGYQVSEHYRLSEELEELQFELSLRCDGAPIGGLTAVAARRFMADTYRLLSRERGGRALLRLPPGPEIARQDLRRALDDAGTGLRAFQRAHSDCDSPREDGWLVAEPLD